MRKLILLALLACALNPALAQSKPQGAAGDCPGLNCDWLIPKENGIDRVRVSEAVARKHLIKPVATLYADNCPLNTEVKLAVLIGKDGKIAAIKVISGYPLVIATTLDAVRRWQFEPYLLNGKPVEVETRLTVPVICKT